MIGILAGMGPKSTGPFIDKVVEQCQKIYGAKYDIDFPHMMIYSCPTPFYIDRPIDHADMERSIITGAQQLLSTGVQFIAMPCNTAHLYFQNIQNAISVPIINMVDETIKEIPVSSKRVAIFATDATAQSGMYQESLLKNNKEFVQKESWQTEVNQIISKIKKGEINKGAEQWNRLCSEVAENVDAVIIACTDLNVVSDNSMEKDIFFVDSSTSLARSVVNKYLLFSNDKKVK
ncbi:amino acid racemase [Brevibacillus panacihumi W25]|uniref:Amino acid racemase n=1 Tax=Brevibacillus panacihumi W25 TaxID=1408254 RepID=V6M5A3_9BACL|nr:amino acid racemase [Brevibacillus panacihumi]EST53502.1 amino acid racemase [Brevibacillus panacihumi W25]